MEERDAQASSTKDSSPKTCPRCGLINPGTAERCDCGYDFASKTVEKPYVTGSVTKGTIQKSLNPFFLLVMVVGGFVAVTDIVAGRWVGFVTMLIWLSVVSWVRREVLRRKTWAPIMFAVLTAPLGLLLLGNRDLKAYCLRKE